MTHNAENDAPPEVLIGALANMIAAASRARDECRDDLRRAWHQGRVSALMDAKRQTESWVAAVRRECVIPPADRQAPTPLDEASRERLLKLHRHQPGMTCWCGHQEPIA